MRTARLVLVLLLASGSSLAAKLPGHEARYNSNNNNNQGQSSANSGSGGSYWWMNNDVFGSGGGNRPAIHTSGNANANAQASTSTSASSSGIASGSGGHQSGGNSGIASGSVGNQGGGSYQTGALQNNVNPPQINVQQQQNFNPNVFTPTQSPHCARGQDCVRWQLCKNGVITLTGKSIPRQQPVPTDMNAKPCGMLGNICCAIPASVLATQQQLGHHNQVQTSNLQQPQQPQQFQNPQSTNNQNQQSFPRPSQQQFQNQANFPQQINNNNIQPEVSKGPPYSECSASLFCIHQSECNLYNGFIEPQIEQWPGQPFVQINMCTSDTLPEGVCCQEPHPEFDPWTERPGLDQQASGSQQQNFQQQVVGTKPQGQQFGRPQGNQGHSVSSNRPQTNIQQPNTNNFQQVGQPAIQQPSQSISFPQQNQPRPQPSNQPTYQQPAQNNIQQPSQNQFQQPAQNNFQQQPQTNNQQPSQSIRPQNNIQTPTQNQFQQPSQNNFQQPNKPINPSHNTNHKPNLNNIGLPNPQSTFQEGPNEQFPSLAPHPTCSSGLFCVERSQCNLYTGFIEEQVQTHPDQQFIAINLCTSPTLKEGVCCQQLRAPGSQDDGQYRGPGSQDDGQYRGPGAINSGQQQTFVQQGSRPQQGFSQQQSQPQQSFVPQNTAPQQGFSQQPQQTVGTQHSGVQPSQPVQTNQPAQHQQQQQQQGGYAWQNSDAFQPQVPSYG